MLSKPISVINPKTLNPSYLSRKLNTKCSLEPFPTINLNPVTSTTLGKLYIHGTLKVVPNIHPNPVSQHLQKPKPTISPESRGRPALWSLQGKEGFGEGKLRIEKDGFPPHISYRKSAKIKRHFFWRIE